MSDTPVNVKTCQNSGPGATRECSPRRSSLFQGFRVGAELLLYSRSASSLFPFGNKAVLIWQCGWQPRRSKVWKAGFVLLPRLGVARKGRVGRPHPAGLGGDQHAPVRGGRSGEDPARRLRPGEVRPDGENGRGMEGGSRSE